MSFTGGWLPRKCCPYDSDIFSRNKNELLSFEVYGYIYPEPPLWFDSNGKQMYPLNSSIDDTMLSYRFNFFFPNISSVKEVYFKTSEDVFPNVMEILHYGVLPVERYDFRNGITTWRVSLPNHN
jgi:hypothetical protein